MKSFSEMRQSAWKIATSRWTLRLFAILFFFNVLGSLIFAGLSEFYTAHSIQTWSTFRASQLQMAQSGLSLSVPSGQQFWEMTKSSGLEFFLQALLGGLLLMAVITLALAAVRREQRGWIASFFSGFKAPLEMMWLNVLMVIMIAIWMLPVAFCLVLLSLSGWPAVLLALVALVCIALRYAMAWYIKHDHPDYSAWRCLSESVRMMDGRKLKLFGFGLTYLGWLLLAVVVALLTVVFSLAIHCLAVLFVTIAMIVNVFVFAYVIFGQAVFYDELKRISKNKNTEDSNADASVESAES